MILHHKVMESMELFLAIGHTESILIVQVIKNSSLLLVSRTSSCFSPILHTPRLTFFFPFLGRVSSIVITASQMRLDHTVKITK